MRGKFLSHFQSLEQHLEEYMFVHKGKIQICSKTNLQGLTYPKDSWRILHIFVPLVFLNQPRSTKDFIGQWLGMS